MKRTLPKLINIFSEYDITLSDDAIALIRGLLNGYEKLYPVTFEKARGHSNAELTIIEDFKYEEHETTGERAPIDTHTHYYDEEHEQQGWGRNSWRKKLGRKRHILTLSDTGLSYRAQATPDPRSNDFKDNSPLLKERQTLPSQLWRISDSGARRTMSDALSEKIVNLLYDFGLLVDAGLSAKEEEQLKRAVSAKISQGAESARRHKIFALTKAVQPDFKKIMFRTGQTTSIDTLNWLYADGDETKQKYRLQAVQSYPVLLSFITGQHLDSYNIIYHQENDERPNRPTDEQKKELCAKIQKLRDSIDDAKPIADQLRHCIFADHVVSKDTIKSLQKIRHIKKNQHSVVSAIKYMDQLNVNWHPRTAEDFEEFCEYLQRAKDFAAVLPHINAIDVMNLARGRWDSHKIRHLNSRDIRNIKDFLDEIDKTVIWPQLIGPYNDTTMQALGEKAPHMGGYGFNDFYKKLLSEKEAVKTALLDKLSPTDILSLSLRWHEQGESYSAAKEALGMSHIKGLYQWKPLSAPTKSPQGLVLTPLFTRAQLHAEGQEMGNCVGTSGYDAKCLTGHDHIISITDPQKENALDRHMATIQLREKFAREGGAVTGLEIVQVQGPKYKNKELEIKVPQKEKNQREQAAKEAVHWYIRELFNNQSMRPDWTEIENDRVIARELAAKEGLSYLCGFNPQAADNRKKAFEIIQPYLPRMFKSESYDSFWQRTDIEQAQVIDNTDLFGKLGEMDVLRADPDPVTPHAAADMPAAHANDTQDSAPQQIEHTQTNNNTPSANNEGRVRNFFRRLGL